MFTMTNAGGHDFRKQNTLFKLRGRLKEFAHPYFVEFGNIISVGEFDVFIEPVSYIRTLIEETPISIISHLNSGDILEYFIAARPSMMYFLRDEKLTNS